MCIKTRKVSALLIILSVFTVFAFSACTKSGDSDTKTTGSATKAASATVAKTTAKATAANTAAASSGAAASASQAALKTDGTIEGNGQAAASNSDGQATDEDDADNGGDTEEQITESAEKEYDLQGRTLRLATYYYLYNRQYFENTDNETAMMVKRVDYLQKKFNCKIEFVPYNDDALTAKTLIENSIAGTYWADMMHWVANWSLKYHDLFQPLNEYIDFNARSAHNTNPGQKFLVINNNVYDVLMQYKITYDVFLMYNADIFQRDGVEEPIVAQRENRWTWNAFLNAAIATTKDLNGDGITDQWGFVTSGSSYLPWTCIASNDAYIIREEKGIYKLAIGEQRALKALYFLNDMHNVYKVAQLDKNTIQTYRNGKAAMTFASMSVGNVTSGIYPKSTVYVMFPIGPDVDRYIVNNNTAGGWTGVMPAIGVKDPEAVAQVLYGIYSLYDDTYPDYLSEPDVRGLFSKFVFSDKDFETIELSKKVVLTDGAHFDRYAYLRADIDSLIFTGENSIYRSILTKNLSVTSAIDTVREMVSDKIDVLLHQYEK